MRVPLESETAMAAHDALASIPGFGSLGSDELRALVARFRPGHADPGVALISEGTPSPGFFLLLRGRVEVSQGSDADRVLLNVLGPGSTFGANSFIDRKHAANATVAAAEPVSFLEIPADDFTEVLETHPTLADALGRDRWATLKANFLAHTAAFGDLDAAARRKLAEEIQAVRVDAGQVIVKQGEAGKACYLIADGEADVLVATAAGNPKKVASLSRGNLVGEGALLTRAPRNATVRMTTPGTVLVLQRDALLEAIGDSGELTADLVSLLRMRWRPKQRPGVEVHERQTPDGDTLVILEDKGRGAYYRLASDGLFIWERLDGQTTLRQIAMEYVAEFKRFDPERIAQAVKGLVDAGFASAAGLSPELEEQQQPKGLAAASTKALAALTKTKAIDDVDEFFGKLDRWVGRWAFSGLGVAILLFIAVAGVATAIVSGPRSGDFLTEGASVPFLLLALIPANAIGAVLHEGAHGVAVKRFGRKVKRAGLGWFVIAPVAFVDTSDMWLESRWRRALVSMAGPFMNVVLGGASAIVAANVDTPVLSALFWQGAIVSYYLAVINLNPLLEFDGYYILSDALDRPNLREDALKWLGTELPKAFRRPSLFKGHGVDIVYGILAALYMALIVFFIIVVYRTLIERFIANLIPAAIAGGLAWLLAGSLSVLMLMALSAQLRGLKAPSH